MSIEEMSSSEFVRRKHGVVSLIRPVSWNKARRFTSPGPDVHHQGSGTNNYTSEGPLLRLQIEAYLDDNPDFAESYVLRKIGRKTIEKWLLNHSVVEHDEDSANSLPTVIIEDPKTPVRKLSENVISKYRSSYTNKIKSHFSAESTPNLKKRSHSVTPSRKISASAFESSGLRSPILTTGLDGFPSFLSSSSSVELSYTTRQRSRSAIISASDLPDRRVSLSDLTLNLVSELDLESLTDKLARSMMNFSAATSCAIAIPKFEEDDEFEVIQTCTRIQEALESNDEDRKKFILDNNTVNKLKSGSIVELSTLEPFPNISDGYTLIPLRDAGHAVRGISVLAGSIEQSNTIMLLELGRIGGICLKNAAHVNSVQLEVTRSQVFLDLARVIFDQQTSLEFTVLKILVNFLLLIECERAQVLLSAKETPTKFYKVFDLDEADLKREDFADLRSPYETRPPISNSISGLVAATKETVNIGDVVSDHRFDLAFEGNSSIKHRSVLCMPLLDCDNETLGVIFLINKRNAKFSENDERFVEAFGVFCGIAIRNVTQYEQARQAEARSQVALEIMAYHAASDVKEAEELANYAVPSALSYNLMSLQFTDSLMEERDTLKACLRMFYELDLVSRFGLDHTTLCRWLLTVKKNYRAEVLYHNWDHAFNVAQMMFSMLLNSGWWENLGPVRCLSLLVACLSHDLDHRGTNNSFQLATDSPLAKLYSTSTLERHHLNQALIILNLDGNRILENLTASEYAETIELLEEAILATDLAKHFAGMGKLKTLAEQGSNGLKWESAEVTTCVCSSLMTAADLGGSTKPWEVQKEVAGLIAEEFWLQGDMEREKLSGPSNTLMDRQQRHNFPQLQAGFCEGVCLPVYKALAELSPNLGLLEESVVRNANMWRNIALNHEQDHFGEPESGDVSSEEKSEEERDEAEAAPEPIKTVRNL